jgi:RHS repeat-associated protein
VNTYRPGGLAALLGKRVYTHTDNDDIPEQTTDYTYAYDAVGNVVCVFDSDGNEVYYFAQDAFGNELQIGAFGGDDWEDAAEDGVSEHQTGKWVDPFTGLYYFWARWYDSVVGRFVGRDPAEPSFHQYGMSANNPNGCVDVAGLCNEAIHLNMTWEVGLQVLDNYECDPPAGLLASRIAHANQRIDDDPGTSAYGSSENRYTYHCFGHYIEGAHFNWRPNYSAITREYSDMLRLAIRCCNSDDLGMALHFRQDCFVHWLFSSITGHAASGHEPDYACEKDPLRIVIRSITENAIRRYADACCTKK